MLRKRLNLLVLIALLDVEINGESVVDKENTAHSTYAAKSLANLYRSDNTEKKTKILSESYPYFISDLFFLFSAVICLIFILVNWGIMLYQSDWVNYSKIGAIIGFVVAFLMCFIVLSTKPFRPLAIPPENPAAE